MSHSAPPLRCITRVQGGLGNQLFCYAHGRAIAAQLGAELVLDISELQRGDLYGRLFELDRVGVRAQTLSSPWLAGIKGRVARRALGTLFRKRVFREPESPVKDAVASRWLYLDGYWQDDIRISAHRRDLMAEIVIAPELLGAPAKALGERLRAEGAIGVHLRSYREEKVRARRSVPGPGYYIASLEQLFAEFGPRPVFIASDVPLGGVDLPRAVRERLVDAGDARSQYEDLFLLRQCSYHVLSNSSFGWWGAFLAESISTYYPANAGYFHYPRPAQGWRVISESHQA